MELKFIGRGAAVNVMEGNTSAYFKENNELFLIDCGESVYREIIKQNILENIGKINLFITHLHCDHIGSLGSLLVYTKYVLQIPVDIIIQDNIDYIDSLKSLFKVWSTKDDVYSFKDVSSLDNKYTSFNKVRFHKTIHSKNLDCYSIVFETNEGIVFYSGDTAETRIMESLVNGGQKIDKLYVDVSSNPSANVHIYIENLPKVIPNNLNNKVYCMHFDSKQTMDKAKELGYNIVDI